MTKTSMTFELSSTTRQLSYGFETAQIFNCIAHFKIRTADFEYNAENNTVIITADSN